MLLLIDTSDHNSLHFALVPELDAKSLPKEFRKDLAFNENYKSLMLLEKFLRGNKVTPKDLQKIVVCSGPGSFNGIRVGISMSQAMGFALSIPVAVITQDEIPTESKDLAKLWKLKPSKKLTASYGREPNITPPKKTVK